MSNAIELFNLPRNPLQYEWITRDDDSLTGIGTQLDSLKPPSDFAGRWIGSYTALEINVFAFLNLRIFQLRSKT